MGERQCRRGTSREPADSREEDGEESVKWDTNADTFVIVVAGE